MMKRSWFGAVSAFAMLVGSGPAHAQSIDYGALAQLFGEPITTSVTGSPQRASEVPADMEIITQDDIRRSGADTIPDILRFIVGLDVRTYGILSAETAIRGYNQVPNPRLLVMINGRQAYIDDYGYTAWSALPVQLDEIRQIEIVKGPNSALFGFNAVSGVINIITYNSLKDDVNALTVRTGTQSLMEGSAVTTLRLGDTAGLRLSAGGLKADDFAPIGLSAGDVLFRDKVKRGTLNLEGRWQVTPKIELMTEGSIVDTRTPMRFGGYFYEMHFRMNSIRVGATADTPLGIITGDFYRNETRLVYASVFGDAPIYNPVSVAKITDLLKLGVNNTIRLGAEYRDTAAEGADFSGRIGYRIYSGSAMWHWQISPALTFTNAVRVDHLALNYAGTLVPGSGYTLEQYNTASTTPVTFNSGLVWKATDIDTVRLTAVRGVQAPSMDDFGVQLPVDPVFIGDPNINPAYLWNVEAGYDRRLSAVRGLVRAAVFVQRHVDVIGGTFFTNTLMHPNGFLANRAANIGSSDQVGAELDIKGNLPSGFRWNAGYAFSAITDHIEPEQANIVLSYERSTPRHVIVFGAGYSAGRWEFDAQGRWQSRFNDYKSDFATSVTTSVPVNPYFSANARIGYKATDFLTVAVAGQKLTQRYQMQTAGPAAERRVIVSATANF